jgi:N-acetylneuraminic acid mutarotase
MRFLPALLLFAMSSITDVEWSELRPMLRAQAGGATAYLDGEVVVAGGTTWVGDVKTWLPDVQIYNPASNTWRSGPALPVPMAYGPFVSSTRDLEVFGGADGQTAQRSSWKLDAAKSKWVRTGSIPEDALLGRAARIGETVLLFGGCRDVVDLTTCSDAVWQRNERGEWRRVSTIPGGPLALAAIAVSGSAVYLFGGCSMDTNGKVVNHARALRYDSMLSQWKTLRDLPNGNRGITATGYGNRSILLFGGYTDTGFTSEVLLYDLQSDTYKRLKPMPLSLAGVEFVLNGRTIYGAGGEDRMRSRSARVFQGKLAVTER